MNCIHPTNFYNNNTISNAEIYKVCGDPIIKIFLFSSIKDIQQFYCSSKKTSRSVKDLTKKYFEKYFELKAIENIWKSPNWHNDESKIQKIFQTMALSPLSDNHQLWNSIAYQLHQRLLGSSWLFFLDFNQEIIISQLEALSLQRDQIVPFCKTLMKNSPNDKLLAVSRTIELDYWKHPSWAPTNRQESMKSYLKEIANDLIFTETLTEIFNKPGFSESKYLSAKVNLSQWFEVAREDMSFCVRDEQFINYSNHVFEILQTHVLSLRDKNNQLPLQVIISAKSVEYLPPDFALRLAKEWIKAGIFCCFPDLPAMDEAFELSERPYVGLTRLPPKRMFIPLQT